VSTIVYGGIADAIDAAIGDVATDAELVAHETTEASARTAAITAAVSGLATAANLTSAQATAAAATAVVAANLVIEATARASGDTSEATARDSAIATAVGVETSARTTADTSLSGSITAAVAAEATARDTAIGVETSARTSAVTGEASARNTAITAAVNAVVNGAPTNLDTLVELAAAIGNDPAYSVSVTAAIAAAVALYLPLTGGTVTGSLTAYKSGQTLVLKAAAGDGTNLIQMYHTGTFGQIESSTGFVLFSDSGQTTITGTSNTQMRCQHSGGSYREINMGHDDTNGTIGTNAGDLLLVPASGVVKANGIPVVGTTAAQTLTSKRMQRRVTTVASSATPTINTDNFDVLRLSALAVAVTSMTTNLTGTPVDGDELRISLTDNGTARAIAWGAKYEASTVALPTTTVISTRLDCRFLWNTVSSKWRIQSAS
jgi:hypothetical protein